MRSSETITIFSERPRTTQRPFSVAVSAGLHIAACGLVYYGIAHAPRINDRIVAEHYTLRHLDLHVPLPQVTRSEKSHIGYPGPQSVAQAPSPEAKPDERQPNTQNIAQLKTGPQTLVQPDLPKAVELTQEVPVPTVVLWAPEKVQDKTIVPPQPQKETASDVKPSLGPPNEEVNLSDMGIAPTDLANQQIILPSSSTPIQVKGPDKPQAPPQTTSVSQAQPTPAAVLSLSDLRTKDGPVTLPPVNQTAPGSTANSAAPIGHASPTQSDKAQPTDKAAGTSGDKPPIVASVFPRGNDTGIAHPGPVDEAGLNNGPTVNRISLPRDGKFGAVVVGGTLEEKYPEAAALWNGRMAYTVYLHVGLEKSWILQYSLSRSDDAAAAGNATRLEAPWPYDIVRPNINAGDINADALMVHGTVNAAGKFETLAVVFPPQFPETSFVLSALQQWQFRPAIQSGQNTPVEVLLIIPEESE